MDQPDTGAGGGEGSGVKGRDANHTHDPRLAVCMKATEYRVSREIDRWKQINKFHEGMVTCKSDGFLLLPLFTCHILLRVLFNDCLLETKKSQRKGKLGF